MNSQEEMVSRILLLRNQRVHAKNLLKKEKIKEIEKQIAIHEQKIADLCTMINKINGHG